MLATVLGLGAALGSPWLVGLPVRLLLRRGQALSQRAWVEAPLVGVAIIILVLQNLVYLNIPLRQSVPWFWGAVGLLWLGTLLRGGLRKSWRNCPRAVLGVGVGVYLFQGVGLFVLGAPSYLGNRLGDQFNYIVLADFLREYPFETPGETVGTRPFLFRALLLKDDRIGQAILHGFLAVTACQETHVLYEATSLLGPALLVGPFYWLARGSGSRRRAALILAATAGLLPAVTQVHLEGFLSQNLLLPFLFAFLVVLPRTLAAPSVERTVVAMLFLAGAVSIYTEYFLILTGLLLVLLVGNGFAGRSWNKSGLLALLILSAPMLLNPLSLPYQLPAFQRLSVNLFTEYFRTRLPALPEMVWLGEGFRLRGWGFGWRGTSILLLGLGIGGLVRLGLRQRRRSYRRPGFLLALGILALASLPVLGLVRRPLNPYMVYKLTLTVGPLLVLGAGGLLLPRFRLGLLFLAALGTTLLEAESIWHRHTPYSHVRSLDAEDFRWATRQLRQLEAREVVLAVEEVFHAPWLSYEGRHHRIWRLPVADAGFPNPAPPPPLPPVYLLVEQPRWPIRTESAEGQLLGTRGRFSLWYWQGALPFPPHGSP
jgi:hypothetical protein